MHKNLFLLGIVLVVVSCTPLHPEKFCREDVDCVPAQCCHPTDALQKDFAPDCTNTICTMECAPDTLDCGQGEIKCIEKQCTVVIS